METLADYGTVAYFAVNTFTTGIYRAWFSLGDRIASAQLAAMLLGFVLLLVVGERLSAAGRATTTPPAAIGLWRGAVRGYRGLLAAACCLVP